MKVGEYCRTKDGHIEKIIDKYKATYGYKIVVNEDFKFKHYEHNYIKHIIKSSSNIIDLIEVGDLVYVDISPDDCGGIIVPRIAETERELNSLKLLIKNKDYILKSIITHEQIESMEYKVKE